jgi:hypothetical protein
MRMVRLALAVGAIERGVGFNHGASRALWRPAALAVEGG